MFKFILSKVGVLLVTLLGVTIVTFSLTHLMPGDPVQLMLGDRSISPEDYEKYYQDLGLHLPLYQQYFQYLFGVLQGDLGISFVSREPVFTEFSKLFPATAELSIIAMFLAIIIGLPLGVLAALNRGKTVDLTVMTTSLAGYSMPIYWWGPIMISIFSVWLGFLPVSGRIDAIYWIEPVTGFLLIDTVWQKNWPAFQSALHHIILPAIVLATVPMAIIARMTRSSLLEVLSEDYIRTAYAKGLAKLRVIFVHALRNALIPVVTIIGLQLGVLLAGAILTETIFAWPGIGRWVINAVFQRDYPAIQSGILLIAACIIIINFMIDLVYGLINPRISHVRK